MITEFGKCLRHIRLDRGILLKDMANTLGITSAYLSSIETGKRKPTKDLLLKISDAYCLDGKTADALNDAYFRTINEINIDTRKINEKQSDLGLIFARKISKLSAEQIKAISNLLK